MKKRRARIVLAFVLLALGAGYFAYRAYKMRQAERFIAAILTMDSKPSWRQDLPVTATDVHEWAWADGFLPDYSYLLKARVTGGSSSNSSTGLGLLRIHLHGSIQRISPGYPGGPRRVLVTIGGIHPIHWIRHLCERDRILGRMRSMKRVIYIFSRSTTEPPDPWLRRTTVPARAVG